MKSELKSSVNINFQNECIFMNQFIIEKVFEEFTNDEVKDEYIIVVATDVSYYLQ